MEQYIKFGYATDENAMTIFVEGDFIQNADSFYNSLDGHDHKRTKRGAAFFT